MSGWNTERAPVNQKGMVVKRWQPARVTKAVLSPSLSAIGCCSSRLGVPMYWTSTSLAERSDSCQWSATDSCLIRSLGWAACSQCRIGASYLCCVRARRCLPMGSLPAR